MKKFREVAEIVGEFVKPCPRRYNLKGVREGKSSSWEKKNRDGE